MWMVHPSMNREVSIIHIDLIFCAALVLMFGDRFIPAHVDLHNAFDTYMGFYINKFADHHAFEIAS